MKGSILSITIILFFTFLLSGCIGKKNIIATVNEEKKNVSDSIELKLVPDPFSSLIEMETEFGVMKIELFFEAGTHRENFIKLAKNHVYESTIFHRVIKNFMIQGGDPSSKNARPKQRLGLNSSGSDMPAEISSRYYHIKGALAAARQPDDVNPEKKSSGSQFYIVHGSSVSSEQLDKYEREAGAVYSPEQRKLYLQYGGAPQLDMNYTVFGRVYEGFSVIDSIASQMTDSNDRPEKDIKIIVRVVKE